jgi:hypothetical protein
MQYCGTQAWRLPGPLLPRSHFKQGRWQVHEKENRGDPHGDNAARVDNNNISLGLGREGSHHGIDDYVEIKYLCIGDVLK